MKDEWLTILKQNKKGILGGSLGLLAGILFLCLGFWRTILLILCTALGFWIGRQFEDKERFMRLLDRILPGGKQ